MSADRIPLFSYGTLQLPEVQLATYGRLLEGHPAALPGYALKTIQISSDDVADISGRSVHPIVVRTPDAEGVAGMVFEITQAELDATDRYETEQYARVWVELESGEFAWVYAEPES